LIRRSEVDRTKVRREKRLTIFRTMRAESFVGLELMLERAAIFPDF
jgi:hypothetical protein